MLHMLHGKSFVSPTGVVRSDLGFKWISGQGDGKKLQEVPNDTIEFHSKSASVKSNLFIKTNKVHLGTLHNQLCSLVLYEVYVVQQWHTGAGTHWLIFESPQFEGPYVEDCLYNHAQP